MSDTGVTEWVVTLRNGQRHDVEAERYDRRTMADGSVHHEFSSPNAGQQPRSFPAATVTLVQKRRDHLLDQVWPAERELERRRADA